MWTIGHSNVPGEALLDQLLAAGIERLVDVRHYPMSRRNPQFNRDALAAALGEHGIEYVHLESLGGRREPRPESTNTALINEGFRGYADYMQTPEFDQALADLIDLSRDQPTAIMCAEALPWRCHRSLISDALVSRGIDVRHLLQGAQRPHQLSPHARIVDGRVVYPALL
ncbi:MAG: DUF488 family protein [Dehalococcoidia bacterium]|nr:DUF488 family protein [Dehalococcoidia bacterium]